MAKPPGTQQEHSNPSSSFSGTNANLVVQERAGHGLKHNPGISMDWTAEEHAILEKGIQAYTSENSLSNYAKIAVHLPNKTIRDVALRCRWMTKKENSKRRKEDLTKRIRDKKERVIDASAKLAPFAIRPNVHSYAPPMMSTDYDDSISYLAIGGPMGEILEQNAKSFQQISANLSALQYQENISLFCQTRENIFKLLNGLLDPPNLFSSTLPDENKREKLYLLKFV
ncbi:uncharacterized protein LOC123195512 isoform X2 [Mangifera indica]|uniref:uncharacterized protein LOC123195512 isoform X2 n=1 Tax=Mangifera indica TaxID=29780 RepID=UPI001CFBD919|nr:uncharacterized protein LOC123195512 isoform X2 [Mangifera indica]